jgi:hypothetical protein
MKNNIYLLLVIIVSSNLFSQNPFVKKIETNEKIKLSDFNYLFDIYSNIQRFDNRNYSYSIKDNKIKKIGYWRFADWEKFDDSSIIGDSVLVFKNYNFRNFKLIYDDSVIKLRGFDNNYYIEFKFYISKNEQLYKSYNVPFPVNSQAIISDFDYMSFIKETVQTKVNRWQQKEEFEKMADYNIRVTKNTLNNIIIQFQQEAIDLLSYYYWNIIGYKASFELKPYDSENETFIITSNLYGDLAIKVAITKAQIFKDNFYSLKFSQDKSYLENDKLTKNINYSFVLSDNKLILSHLVFNLGENSWTFDLNNKLKYTNTKIDYYFDKIDLNLPQSSLNRQVTKIENKNISVGKSSVDFNIPENVKVANRYALIIGNEDYLSMQRTLNSEQNVPFAVNDASVFRDYAIKTLGVEQENITFLTNATAGQMAQQIDKVCKMLVKLGNKAELIVYYAGHGYPDENSKIPYLVPVDVSASNLEMGIKLNDLYKNLSATNAKRVVVFLDACFTGGGRSYGLLASRGIKVIPKEDALNGNIVVVSASSGLQSALPYQNEKHGMFSYYLFKKLQESKGNIALGDLFIFLKESVSLQSLKINNKEQDPTINVSPAVEQEYSKWNFKN